MTIPASVMMKLATIGLSVEQAQAVASMLSEVEAATKVESEAVVEKSRSKARERVQKWREKNSGNVTERNVTQRNDLRASDARGDVKQNNLEIPNSKKEDNADKPLSDLSGFKAALQPVITPERIDAVVAHRRKKKAGVTAHTGKLLASALNACPDANAAADEMVLRNWTSVKPEWLSSGNQRGQPPPQPARKTLIDVIDERQERRNASIFDSLRTIDHEPDGSGSSPIVRFPTDASRR